MSRRREFPDEHEQPWTEEEWLADMKRNDARADRFGELLETLQDAPDRDERIAREMGWDDMADALAAEERGELDDSEGDEDDEDDEANAPFGSEVEHDDEDDAFDPGGEDEDLEDHREPEPEMVRHPDPEKLLASVPEDEKERTESLRDEKLFGRDASRDIAEYQFAHLIGMKLHWALREYSSGDADEDPTDGLLGQALIGPHIASAKIVGGHSLGYSKHYINGNIACQRIGLDAVDKSIQAYDLLVKDRHVPAKFVKSIMPDLKRLREVLAARIERMRAYARTLHVEE